MPLFNSISMFLDDISETVEWQLFCHKMKANGLIACLSKGRSCDLYYRLCFIEEANFSAAAALAVEAFKKDKEAQRKAKRKAWLLRTVQNAGIYTVTGLLIYITKPIWYNALGFIFSTVFGILSILLKNIF